FKNLFTGLETRDYTRATTAQKCVRAGGKHNDLDNVGYTARHHTFFEMLGNFSFGDYFKEEAIARAWELVHGEFGLPKDRLLVTIYHTDDEAYDLWRKIAGFSDREIIRIATKDNFWAMGDTGPCGPCSEIFYDHGADIPGGPPGSPDEDGDRFVEIWNLVFMQFEMSEGGAQAPLPRPSIDTGMGLERIAAVLQGVHDNYDTDLFRTLIEASVDVAGAGPQDGDPAAHRVIADHLRASCFLIADGVMPSNEGRGYVLRRIMRRAMRYAHTLGAREPVMHRLAPTLIGLMGGAYPELRRAEALILETLRLEEERFLSMLERGMKLLSEALGGLAEGAALPGETAFKLYDTYGFPLDLTQDALRRKGVDVDVDGFDAAMAKQRAEARANWAGSGSAATDKVWFDIREDVGPTEFLGYAHDAGEALIQAIVKEGVRVDAIAAGEAAEIVVNQTPFYAESGGQVGDLGTLQVQGAGGAKVRDVQKKADALFVHICEAADGPIRVGDVARLAVDADRRNRIRANHSVTHLLHAALRNVLGPHVAQKGSLVGPDRLRFDFSHGKAVTVDELRAIEAEVNAVVRQNGEVSTRLMAPDAAIEAGALALFGEKYGEEVRVLTMGDAEDGESPYSVELCGGTHVRRLGDIALFSIVGEGAVASGVRRVEAMTGEAARGWLEDQAEFGRKAADALKTPLAELPGRVAALNEETRRLRREVEEARKALALGGGGAAKEEEPVEIAGVAYLGRRLDGVAPKDLRALVDEAKSKMGSGVVAYIGVNDGKAALAVGVTEDLTGRFSAVDLVRAGAAAVGGKGGGGRADMAQAGGPDGARAEEAIAAISNALAQSAAPA
ncbi:MAG: alanine--tRNA ligase, partial [Pseudomonadota bacterium]